MHDVEPHRRADVAMDTVTAQRRQWSRDNHRPRALSAREALAAVHFECLLIWVYGGNLLAGLEQKPEDRERISIALRRIEELTDEAIG
jgi:hypothetical protein